MTRSQDGVSRRSLISGGAVAVIAAPALVGRASAQAQVTWRVQAHWPQASGSFRDSLGVLATELDRRTEGAFKLEPMGAGEFAGGTDIYPLVRRGVVPMGTISPSYIEDRAQAATFLYGIPGTLREAWEMQHAVKNLGIEDLVNEDLASDGVLILSEKVLPTEMALSRPITSAEDFRGLKIRSSGTMLSYLAAAGAAPQFIGGSELYQALSSGVVDGAHWGAAIGAQSMSLWEVARYHHKPVLAQTTDSYIINIDALEGLEPDLRSALLSTIESRFFLRTAEYQHQEAIALSQGIANDGVEVVHLPDDVLEMLAEASTQILETEGQKGERAAAAADVYRTLMRDMGYTS